MWHYMLMFLLVNTYGTSFGTPLKNPVWNPNLFNDLPNRCKNEFVSSQIALKAKDCNVTSPLFQDLQLRCLVFYDASSILCDIPDTTFPNLETDFTVKTSDKQNVTNFCGESAHFSIPVTSNQQMMTQIFQNGLLCLNICVDENLLSGDTNFVCKYYKWMLSVLQSLHTAAHETSQTLDISGKASGTETKGLSSSGKTNEVTTINVNNTPAKVIEPENDVSKVVVQGNSNITSTQRNINLASVVAGVDPSTEHLSGVKNQQSNQTLKDHNQVEEKADKTVETKKHVNPEGGLDNDMNPNGESNPVGKDFVIEHPQQVNAGDDEDDGEDPGMDTAGEENRDDNLDGDEDDRDDRPGDTDPRQNNEEKLPDNHGEPQIPINGESSQRDIFPNAMSDAFPEDDDHFFPFFLTAVIVVVILYVLYHNKSKVGKMFFGLIVEGRQPGRRRNSRGHAYRRLDTLEQAMSANTTAPPSKIIY